VTFKDLQKLVESDRRPERELELSHLQRPKKSGERIRKIKELDYKNVSAIDLGDSGIFDTNYCWKK
jgi:hypothetical protein